MKASALDLRTRGVQFIQAGGAKVAAGRGLALGRSTVDRDLAAVKTNRLPPRPVGVPGASLPPPNSLPPLKSIPPPRWRNSKKSLPLASTRSGHAETSSAAR